MKRIQYFLWLIFIFSIFCNLCFSQQNSERKLEPWEEEVKRALDTSNLTPKDIRDLKKSAEKAKAEREAWWRTPIKFYGLVVDETGKPIPKIKFRFIVNDESFDGTTTYYRLSDKNGRVELKGVSGKGMSIKAADAGYYASGKNPTSAEFADDDQKDFYTPDIQSPLIFKMQKRKAPESVVVEQDEWTLEPDGTPIYLNLMFNSTLASYEKKDSADLVVSYNRKLDGQGKAEWTLILEASGNGDGLILTRDEFMFEAPSEGYQNKIVLQKKNFTEEGGSVAGAIYLYLRSQNGAHYARIKLNFMSWVQQADIDPKTNKNKRLGELSLKWVLNPVGSKNLEYDYGYSYSIRLLPNTSYKLVAPTTEDIQEAKEIYYGRGSDPFENQILNTYDFFP